MLIELRVLLGPNADIPAPAIRVTLAGPTEPGLDLCEVIDRIARAAGAYVGPAVSRTGGDGTVVVAFPWLHEGTGEAIGHALVEVLRIGPAVSPRRADRHSRRHGARRGPGDPPRLLDPAVPTVAVTGTNGKTTTTRLLGRMAAEAGLLAAWSSTDGVFVAGRLHRAGGLVGARWGPHGARGAGGGLRRPGDGARWADAARDGRVGRGRGGVHQRQPGSPRAAGDRHRRDARVGEVHGRQGRASRGLGGPQRRGSAGQPVPRCRAGEPLVLRPGPRRAGCATRPRARAPR